MSVSIPAGRINKLFGTDGGVMLSLYADFPADFDTDTPLLVTIDALEVPLWCERFERRGASGAVAAFADFDTERRAQELLGLEFRIRYDEEDDDEFYMEDLIGFAVTGFEMRHGGTENNGNNSDGENNSEDYDVWSSVSFKVAPGITFGGRYTIVPQKKGTDYYFYMQSHGETMKDYFIVLTQDLTSADGKRIYEVTTSDKIPVDAYFPSDYADEVSITENKATVVFVIGSVKDSQTIVLKN